MAIVRHLCVIFIIRIKSLNPLAHFELMRFFTPRTSYYFTWLIYKKKSILNSTHQSRLNVRLNGFKKAPLIFTRIKKEKHSPQPMINHPTHYNERATDIPPPHLS